MADCDQGTLERFGAPMTIAEAKEGKKLEKVSLEAKDIQRLDTALHMANERLTEFKGRIHRAVALVEEVDGSTLPVVIESDVQDGAPFRYLRKELANKVFGRVSGATRIIMSFSIVHDLSEAVPSTALMAMLM